MVQSRWVGRQQEGTEADWVTFLCSLSAVHRYGRCPLAVAGCSVSPERMQPPPFISCERLPFCPNDLSGQGIITKAHVRHNEACRSIHGSGRLLADKKTVEPDAITSEVRKQIERWTLQGYSMKAVNNLVAHESLELSEGQTLGRRAARKVSRQICLVIPSA